MKRILAALVAIGLCLTAVAQVGASVSVVPPPVHHSVSFVARHGEAFNVYIDGELQNRLPQSRVLVNEVSDQHHEVVVVLKRPAEKAAVLQLRPGERTVVVNVNYDPRLEQLYLYTAAQNRPEGDQANIVKNEIKRVLPSGDRDQILRRQGLAQEELHPVSDEDVDSMLVRMKKQPFDSDRLALAKVIVSSSQLSSAQIARLAEIIDFSNSQVDFLKYAYAYCIDPVNYYHTVDVLTFTSDKRKVLDYIATQR